MAYTSLPAGGGGAGAGAGRASSQTKNSSKLDGDHLSHRPTSFIFVWKYFSRLFAHL